MDFRITRKWVCAEFVLIVVSMKLYLIYTSATVHIIQRFEVVVIVKIFPEIETMSCVP